MVIAVSILARKNKNNNRVQPIIVKTDADALVDAYRTFQAVRDAGDARKAPERPPARQIHALRNLNCLLHTVDFFGGGGGVLGQLSHFVRYRREAATRCLRIEYVIACSSAQFERGNSRTTAPAAPLPQ